MVELDPRTGKRVAGNKAVNMAIDMEATALLYRDGWYYLLGTHGTCCDGRQLHIQHPRRPLPKSDRALPG